MKRLIPLFLASALLLTGCPGSDKQTDSDTPAETTAAVTEAPSEPAETESAEQTDAPKQTKAKAKKDADTKEMTAAGTTAKQSDGNAAPAAPAQDELPVIGGESADPAPAPQTPVDSDPDDEITFNEDGVIELPIIPIR
ncbi:MAG: hypothetical protein IKG82_03590 [Oscillospiraceae bacterium]|nr:hypothetical protein [Oscillospiraceae bacterium]